MLKEKTIKIEDKESADYGKTFKVKQAPVLKAEKMLSKLASAFSIEMKNIKKIDIKKIDLNSDALDDVLSEMLHFMFFINENGVEVQLINDRADNVIEELSTLLKLRKEFLSLNTSFMKLVTSAMKGKM